MAYSSVDTIQLQMAMAFGQGAGSMLANPEALSFALSENTSLIQRAVGDWTASKPAFIELVRVLGQIAATKAAVDGSPEIERRHLEFGLQAVLENLSLLRAQVDTGPCVDAADVPRWRGKDRRRPRGVGLDLGCGAASGPGAADLVLRRAPPDLRRLRCVFVFRWQERRPGPLARARPASLRDTLHGPARGTRAAVILRIAGPRTVNRRERPPQRARTFRVLAVRVVLSASPVRTPAGVVPPLDGPPGADGWMRAHSRQRRRLCARARGLRASRARHAALAELGQWLVLAGHRRS